MAVFIWWSIIYLLMLHYQPAISNTPFEIEERALKVQSRISVKSIPELKPYLRNEGLKKGVPDLASKTGFAMANVDKINKNKTTEEVIWEIADVVVPLVVAAVSLIPVVGPAIGAGLAFLYGVLSMFLRKPPENPMKIIVDDIYAKLEDLYFRVYNAEKTIMEQLRKERNAQFGIIIQRAFQSEVSRNEYICSKYVRVSNVFRDDLKNNGTMDESLRIEMIALLQDCDNFLKDTTEAFVHPDFAHVLWIPSVYMTFIRVMFLAEFCNYGLPLKIDEETIIMFWQELKADTKRHLSFTVDYAVERGKTLESKSNFTGYEYAACKMQKMLFYFDREIYPYGVPSRTVISDDESEVKIADFNVTAGCDEVHHIQIFHNDYKGQDAKYSDTVMNCLMSLTEISRLSTEEMMFRVTYVPQKSYQVRVLYFIKENTIFKGFDHPFYSKHGGPKNISLSAHKETKEEPFQVIRIIDADPSQSPQRFDFWTAMHEMDCDSEDRNCYASGSAYVGTFVVETVHAFNVLSDTDANSTIILEDVRRYGGDVLLLGVELIVRPLQDFLSTW